MPVPYQFLHCDGFPELELGSTLSTKVQTALPWGDPSAETSLTYLGLADDQQFERYDVLHQVERDVDAFYNQQLLSRILENRRFKAYFHRPGRYFLVCARRIDARSVFERLGRQHEVVKAQHEEIDLRKVLGLGNTTGAYFGNLQIDKVRTAAVFGSTTVVESDEWEHYSELGDLSVLYMRVMSDDGSIRTLTLTRDRGVLLMKNMGERLNLSFIATLQQSMTSLTGSSETP